MPHHEHESLQERANEYYASFGITRDMQFTDALQRLHPGIAPESLTWLRPHSSTIPLSERVDYGEIAEPILTSGEIYQQAGLTGNI